jgi:hypothetical protein
MTALMRNGLSALVAITLIPVGFANALGINDGDILIGGAGDAGQVAVYDSNLTYRGTLVDSSPIPPKDPFESGDRYQRTATPRVQGGTLRAETKLGSTAPQPPCTVGATRIDRWLTNGLQVGSQLIPGCDPRQFAIPLPGGGYARYDRQAGMLERIDGNYAVIASLPGGGLCHHLYNGRFWCFDTQAPDGSVPVRVFDVDEATELAPLSLPVRSNETGSFLSTEDIFSSGTTPGTYHVLIHPRQHVNVDLYGIAVVDYNESGTVLGRYTFRDPPGFLHAGTDLAGPGIPFETPNGIFLLFPDPSLGWSGGINVLRWTAPGSAATLRGLGLGAGAAPYLGEALGGGTFSGGARWPLEGADPRATVTVVGNRPFPGSPESPLVPNERPASRGFDIKFGGGGAPAPLDAQCATPAGPIPGALFCSQDHNEYSPNTLFRCCGCQAPIAFYAGITYDNFYYCQNYSGTIPCCGTAHDPPGAVGYDVSVEGGVHAPRIAAVSLPHNGDDSFDIYRESSSGGFVFDGVATADQSYPFPPSGVDKVRILGLESPAAISDVYGFPIAVYTGINPARSDNEPYSIVIRPLAACEMSRGTAEMMTGMPKVQASFGKVATGADKLSVKKAGLTTQADFDFATTSDLLLTATASGSNETLVALSLGASSGLWLRPNPALRAWKYKDATTKATVVEKPAGSGTFELSLSLKKATLETARLSPALGVHVQVEITGSSQPVCVDTMVPCLRKNAKETCNPPKVSR